jgi:hypothetical protein
MKLFVTSMLFLVVAGTASAQEASSPRPADAILGRFEYGNIRWRDEKGLLDHYADQLKMSETLVLYVFAYSGVRPCKRTARVRAHRARNYLITKYGIASDRVIWKDGGFGVDISTELWLLRRSDTPPTPYSIVEQSSVQFIPGCRSARGRRAKVRARITKPCS